MPHFARAYRLRPLLRYAPASAVVAGTVLLVCVLAWLAVALHRGALPPFLIEIPLQDGAGLLIRNKRPCRRSEPSVVCYYRLSGPQTFAVVYRAPTAQRELLSITLATGQRGTLQRRAEPFGIAALWPPRLTRDTAPAAQGRQ
ncbi:MAG: hypothetical protein DIU80_010900 [Chloroflexota bacterium]